MAVPTNVITGFLGVGKTSAILHLLKSKPANESWAVLVNEFGEIGVDGSLFQGQHGQDQGVFIREVPGGCMCCAAGLPMQVALNQLLVRAKPDRLLIEPTGLGHPEEVLRVLSSEYYRGIISLQRILTLVDARKLSDPRYTEHATFNQQIAIADVVVGNKLDLYLGEEKSKLEEYVSRHGSRQAEVIFTHNGKVPAIYLEGKVAATEKYRQHHHHHPVEERPLLSEVPIPECGYIRAVNEGEGFQSIGWRFASYKVFDHERILSFLHGVCAERAKAVVATDRGVFGYNLVSGTLEEMALQRCVESRIEIIADRISDGWEEQLMACILPDS